MAVVKELKIETDRLSSDIENLRNCLSGIKKSGHVMMTSIQQLSSMWEGEAKEAFTVQFESDYKTLENLAGILEKLIQELENAKNQYNNCEKQVGSIIESIRV